MNNQIRSENINNVDINRSQNDFARTPIGRLVAILTKSKPASVGASLVLFIILVAIFGDFLTPHNPNKQNLTDALSPPMTTKVDKPTYILGTDYLGRDVFSRIVFGARASLFAGFSAAIIAAIIGTLLGLFAGFYGGKLDTVIMRIVDIQLAFPLILLALALIAAVGANFRNLIIRQY